MESSTSTLQPLASNCPCSSSSSSSSSSCSPAPTSTSCSMTVMVADKAALPKVSANRIPKEILEDEQLNKWMETLPKNYDFEIHKTIHRIRLAKARRVALQFPEGLTLFAPSIADLLSHFTDGAEMVILGDVTYGACCVDDFAAKALRCDFLVHYGHSCLVSIRECLLPNMMYVFVEIRIDVSHFIETIRQHCSPQWRVVMLSTIQFVGSLRLAVEQLNSFFDCPITIPQNRPLSGGEVLGCTSPSMDENAFDAAIFLGDGRFHLESFMIANPNLKAFKYDPYAKVFSIEQYDITKMKRLRREAIDRASTAQTFGLILGTLGRQGRPPILERLENLFRKHNKRFITLLLSEIFPDKLKLLTGIDAFIQVACPRLSIDWGYAFPTPLLTPYEAEVCLGEVEWCSNSNYPMDHYSNKGGKWAAYTSKD